MSTDDESDNIYWSDAFAAVGLCLAIMFSTALGFMIFKDHVVTRYYLGGGVSSKGFCVKAETTWDEDLEVYCSDNIVNAVGMMADLNDKLRSAPR